MRRDRYQHRHRSLVRDTAPLSAAVALETQAEIAGYPVSAVQPPPAWIEAIAVSEETKKALRLYHAARMADAASKRAGDALREAMRHVPENERPRFFDMCEVVARQS
jgi:hypothetical protein